MREIDLERQYEKLLNIKTTGRDDTKADTYRYPYEPTPYCVLERLANSGYITKKDVVLDYGCGKGRVEFFLSYHTRCKTIGIEYDERIYQTAKLNKEKGAMAGRVTFELEDATNYEVASDVTRIFFFNPFSEEILKKVIGKIIISAYENSRDIYLMFYYPSNEYVSYLMTCSELELLDEIDCGDLFEENKEREKILIFKVVLY